MTKNEERNITKCVRSLHGFDEIFVVDSNSTDRTCAIASDCGAHVVTFTWNGQYPKKKQWCLENLPFRNQWVLYVDADEEVTDEVREEVRSLFATGTPRCAGYFVGYRYWFMGRLMRYGLQVRKLVLFRRAAGRFMDYPDLDIPNMWEVEGHYQPTIDGRVGSLSQVMWHKDHDDLYHFFEKLNRYSDWEAVLRERGALRVPGSASSTPRSRRVLQWLGDRVPLRSVMIFLYSYVVRLGFMDGMAGLMYARALGTYYSMIAMKMSERKRSAAMRGVAGQRPGGST